MKIEILSKVANHLVLLINNRAFEFVIKAGRERGSFEIWTGARRFIWRSPWAGPLSENDNGSQARGSKAGPINVCAVMPGKIVNVAVTQGDIVTRDQVLVVVEAMKMENEIRSPIDGRVTQVLVSPGDSVEKSTHLVRIDPEKGN